MPKLAVKESLEISVEKICDDAALELQRITERAGFAIQVVTQAIRTQETIAKGKVLLKLKEAVPDGQWTKFLQREDVGLTKAQAQHLCGAAEMYLKAEPLYDEDTLLLFGASSLHRMNNLPLGAQLDLLDEAEETGKAATQREVTELISKPETKLAKAQEDLAALKAKRKAAKEAKDETFGDPETTKQERDVARNRVASADAGIENLENRIKQLEAELEREKQHKQELSEGLNEAEDNLTTANKKLEQAQKDLASALEEAHNLRFDGDTAKAQRISRVGNALMLALPQTLSDVQKYVAERDEFAEKVQTAVDAQVKTLLSYLQEHFAYATDEEN